jgi:hypothetical protein
MTRQKTPQEKKTESYLNDYKNISEYPEAFQKTWPRKKRRTNRRTRRLDAEKIRFLAKNPDESDIDVRTPVPRMLFKWTPVRLGAWVADRQEMRARRTAWNYFKQKYVTERHKEGFQAFLDEVVKSDPKLGYNQQLAKQFQLVMAYDPKLGKANYHWFQSQQIHEWLKGFFRDVPEAKRRLLRWIEKAALE